MRRPVQATIPLGWAAAAFLATSLQISSAVQITVVNPGFENPSLGDNRTSQRNIPGWNGTDPGLANNFGVFNPPVRYFPNQAPGGQNVAYTERGSIYQTLTEILAPNWQYCLQVMVGNSLVDLPSPFRIEIRAGTTVLAQSTDAPPAAGTFKKVTVNYTSLPNNPSNGQAISLWFVELDYATTTEVYYDNVVFTKSPVPDAGGTLFALSAAMVPLMALSRQRSSSGTRQNA